ncbi:MAG TPA: hypothetical protein VGR62_15325 [Candidatus Binatia bacterium]|jgi:hypothetical protein|nr:hypothetical protein [Candidatus Binatia bacterium]
MRALALTLAFALAGMVGVAAGANGNTALCGGTCFRAARGEARECRGSADAAFLLDRALCLDRDPACVGACLETSVECREATGIGAAIGACTTVLEQSVATCVVQHPAGSKRSKCIHRAQLDAYQCRQGALQAVAPTLRQCTATGVACRRACGPGTPPAGAETCIDDATAARREALVQCRRTWQVSGSACLGKDDDCVQPCRDARDMCEAPIDAAFGNAVAACLQVRDAALAACAAANPAGSAALASCEESAGADAFNCRLAARDAAAPGLSACNDQYATCVRACPAQASP